MLHAGRRISPSLSLCSPLFSVFSVLNLLPFSAHSAAQNPNFYSILMSHFRAFPIWHSPQNEIFTDLHQSRAPRYPNHRWNDDFPIAKSCQRRATASHAASHSRRSPPIHRRRRKTPPRSLDQSQPRAVGAGNLHHRRHRNSSGASGSERESRYLRARRTGAAVRTT